MGRRLVMRRRRTERVVVDLDRGAGATAHGRAAIGGRVVLALRRLGRGALVMVLVTFRRHRRDRSYLMIRTMARACDLTSPQQLGNQEDRGDKAGSAPIRHDGV